MEKESERVKMSVWFETSYLCQLTMKHTLMKVIPTTSPLLGADLLKASMETISASTLLTKQETCFALDS